MKRSSLAAALAIVALFAASSGHAAQDQKTYVGGTIEGTGVTGTAFGQNIAGASFTLNSPTKIKVVDAASEDVGWLACQDDGDTICGQGDDHTQSGCATGGWQNLQGFGPGETVVFIYTTGATLGCSGVGTTGTIAIQN